jgi:putative integrase
MKTSSILDTYQTWLTHREYSPATIQKYTKALARFFADTGAGDIPTRETVAAWRDSLTEKGYTPATVNAMLAAVNDYQESIDNVAGKAKPLKHQRRIFADPGRELTRARVFPPAERRTRRRQQAHPTAAGSALLHRYPCV